MPERVRPSASLREARVIVVTVVYAAARIPYSSDVLAKGSDAGRPAGRTLDASMT
jgi:hypothetical protein